MIKILFSFLIMTILSSDPLWARAKEVVEREYDAFRTIAPVMPNVGKAEQFLEDLTKKGQVDDIIAMLNKGDGVRGFSKKDRKYYTPEEAKIALNALFLAKQRSPGVFPFKEGIDSFGSKAVQTHRHFVKVAWRLLDPALGYLKAETDFKTNDRAYREFRALVREHMKFGNMNLQSHGEGDTLYVDNGVSVTQQYKYLNLPTIPCFHAYHPADSKISEDGTVLSSYTIYSSLRLKLPTPEIRKFLPQNVQDAIKDISSENLEICVMVQVFLWDVDTLYRPQPWLDPDAPFAQIDYNHAFNVTVSSYPVPTGNTISHAEGPITEGVNTHTEGGTNYIVSSGASPSAGGVLNDKRGTNFSLYSLTQVNNITAYKPESGKVQAPGRYALTLHWMLNENGQTRMQKIAETLSKLSNLKIYHLSELIDTESALNKLYRFGF